MIDTLLDFAHSELIAYLGMILILSAFFILEVAWFAAAALGLWSLWSSLSQ